MSTGYGKRRLTHKNQRDDSVEDFVGRKNLIPPERLRELSERSDTAGTLRMGSQLVALMITGLGLHWTWGTWWAVPGAEGGRDYSESPEVLRKRLALLEQALETISDGFVLYDANDRVAA